MSINQTVDLNLSASVVPPVLNMAQYDANSRTIVATLWDGASGFTIPAGAVVMVRFGKPDGTGGLYDKTEAGTAITYNGNVVTAPVATQMLSVAGKVQADIEIYQTGATAQAAVKLATFCFVVNVEKVAFPDAKIISSDYYNIISAGISEFKTAQEQIIASQAALEEVAKSITGKVESAQQAAQTATEKASAAATSAQNAANSKTAAESAKTAAENAKTAAQTAKTGAESAKTAAANSATAANTSKEEAQSAKAAAESAKTAAETAKQDAESAATEAQNAATAMQECAPYSSTKSYVVGNMVTSGGSTYRCIAPCTGIAPPNSTYWLVIAQKGKDGMGAGDMLKATYDPNNKAQDVFKYADDKAGNVQTNLDNHTENTGIHVTAEEKTAWNAKANPSDIPDKLSELSEDTTHRLVSDTEKTEWNAKVKKSSIVTATLLSIGWTGDAAPYTYALTVSGVTATSNQEVLPALNITAEQLEALQGANIQDGGQAENSMTLKAYGDKPTIDLPIRVIKRGD